MNLQLLGNLNIPMLLAIVFVVAMIRKLDKGNKLKGWVFLVHVAVTAVAVLFITTPLTLQGYFANLFIYSAVTGYGYDFLKKGAFEKFGKKIIDEKEETKK